MFKRFGVFIVLFLLTAFPAFADNMSVSQGSGKTIRTDTISGIEHPGNKLTLGANDTDDGFVSKTNPMPVTSRRDDAVSGVSTVISGTTPVAVLGAGGTGVRHYVDMWTAGNESASVGTIVELLDGATVIDFCPAATSFGGCVKSYPTPLRGTAATALNCRNRTTGAAVTCSVSGYDSSN